MSFKPKYKIGDEFPCTLKIVEIIDDGEDEYGYTSYNLEVVGSVGNICLTEEDGWFTREMMDAAFDPNYKERERLKRIRELEEELEKLRNE